MVAREEKTDIGGAIEGTKTRISAAVRAEMASRQISVEQLVELSGVSAPTITIARTVGSVGVEKLAAILAPLGLEVQIVKKAAA